VHARDHIVALVHAEAVLEKAQENKELLTEADEVYETVKDQIIATGLQSEATARHSAQIYPAAASVYVEKARKLGHDVGVKDMFEMMGFKVERETPDQTDVDETSRTIYDQDIPADLQITMDKEMIETGEIVQETFNARELDNEINGKIESYKALRDCL